MDELNLTRIRRSLREFFIEIHKTAKRVPFNEERMYQLFFLCHTNHLTEIVGTKIAQKTGSSKIKDRREQSKNVEKQ